VIEIPLYKITYDTMLSGMVVIWSVIETIKMIHEEIERDD
jgi:hypothetical protein